MVTHTWHAKSDVTEIEPLSTDFFELLRRLEKPGQRFGRDGNEPARLGQPIRLAFATTDVTSMSVDDAYGPAKVSVNVIGLFGPEGPMPLHVTRWMFERASNRWFAGDDANATSDTAFLDFGNLLQHRMITLYWRAWADARPEVQIQHGKGGRDLATVRALAGTGLEAADDNHSTAKVQHATSLFQKLKSPKRLTEYLATVTGEKVRLREFVGTWTDIPKPLQSRLGQSGARLGQDTVVGSRFFERASHAEICLELGLEAYTRFLDSEKTKSELRHALSYAMGHEISFDLRLELRADEVPKPQIGTLRLGQIAWLGKVKTATADDMVQRRITGGEPHEAAA